MVERGGGGGIWGQGGREEGRDYLNACFSEKPIGIIIYLPSTYPTLPTLGMKLKRYEFPSFLEKKRKKRGGGETSHLPLVFFFFFFLFFFKR